MKVFAAYETVLAGVKLATQVFEVDALPDPNVLPHTKIRKLLAHYLLILNKLFIVRLTGKWYTQGLSKVLHKLTAP